ncbi:dUTP diphosphatase [Spiroplasma tabanidicola]|uniref:dUTP diphosphatase n=1 Tax=Spiroplasma tabanidicola TaxID=324079 RepID=A0A6I6CJC9_9MOLU|nr:dUTP diphosphatase [Spiroplasma tabanidicola]QGS52173.1 dUTP diphosphatase [Spiroplasma tabanidicola]
MLNEKNLNFIIDKQKELDKYIETKWNITNNEEILSKKIVALYVEICEFINEQRAFKFWSNKKPSEKNILLEEYIDGIHFIVSIGYLTGFKPEDYNFAFQNNTIIDAYLNCLQKVGEFNKNRNVQFFTNMLDAFFSIAKILDFSEKEIIEAYIEKNKVNFERQDNNY